MSDSPFYEWENSGTCVFGNSPGITHQRGRGVPKFGMLPRATRDEQLQNPF